MAEFFKLTTAEVSEQIRRKELSPVDLAHSLLDRLDTLEPTLHAWLTIDWEEVLGTARRLEQEQKRGHVLPRKSRPNQGAQATASSVRSAPASGSG